MLNQLYVEKNNSYYGLVREEILALIPKNARRLLDVGCGSGDTSRAAKDRLGLQEAVGIELFESAASAARVKLDRVIVGDIEELELDFSDGYFDCILCADVLEHTKDPWLNLRKIRQFLADDGVLIVSLPNLRHIVPVLKIIFDRLEYEESGILDKTHLRFFSLHTMRNMFRETGFTIQQIETNRSRSWKFKLLHLFSLGLLRPFSVFQYIFVLKKQNI